MKYYFNLGKNNALALAELNSVLNLQNPQLLAEDFLIAEISESFNAEKLINRLGGTIKIGVIREILKKGEGQNKVTEILIKIAKEKQEISESGKFNFGFSAYGNSDFNKKDIGIKIKNYFRDKNLSSRFVISQEKTLSSVVITQNKLLKRGVELVGIKKDGEVFLGETLAVQPFKDLSRRDFGRPARDDLSGMLPPKLAMIMINLAELSSDDSVIIDPFCGSGTVLNEAALMNYKNLFGSDISKRAVDDTYTNFSWLKDLYKIDNVKLKLAVRNVLALSKFIKSESADAIITEPFLGPQRGMINFSQVISELETLYSGAITEFKKVLKIGGKVVMVWPSFYGQRAISPSYEGFKIINLVPENLINNPLLNADLSPRKNPLYSRSGQKVFREIVILERE